MTNWKKIFISSIIGAVLTTAITLAVVYSGYIKEDYKLFIYIAAFIIYLLYVLFLVLQKEVFSKFIFSIIALAAFFLILFLILDRIGFLKKIESVDSLRQYIESTGSFSIIVFIIIQFLQVVLIPIPGSVTTLAGAIMFGSVWGAIYSYIGIVLGSIVAFFIGRVFGYKLVKWIVGEEQLKKGLKLVEGKDKIMFTMIFLLPFFPDDIICFVAGLTQMSSLSFIIIIAITRIVTIAATSFTVDLVQYFLNENIVLGIVVISIGIILTIVAFFIVIKHGEKIEDFFKRIFRGKKKREDKAGENEIVTNKNADKDKDGIEKPHDAKSAEVKDEKKIKKAES